MIDFASENGLHFKVCSGFTLVSLFVLMRYSLNLLHPVCIYLLVRLSLVCTTCS